MPTNGEQEPGRLGLMSPSGKMEPGTLGTLIFGCLKVDGGVPKEFWIF